MKKIIFASHDAGGGHRAPAEAIQKALNELYPGKYDTVVYDFIEAVGCKNLAENSKKAWDKMLAMPLLNKIGIVFLEIFPFIIKAYYNIYLRPFFPLLEKFLEQNKVDCIFSTHFFNSYALTKLKRKNKINFPVFQFIAEIYDVSVLWYFGNDFPYVVCSEKAKKLLLKRKVKEDVIHVFPYPIKPHFTEITRSKNEIKRSIGINNLLPTLLISFGAQGVGNIEKFINILIKNKLNMNIVVVTGKNKKLYKKLIREYRTCRNGFPNIYILGFATNMNEIIYASDFCFIKPGPATTMECLSLGKPVIFYLSATFSELTNVNFVVKKKVGFYAMDNEYLFLRYVKKLLDENFYESLTKKLQYFSVSDGAYKIAKFLDNYLSNN
ncbi:MAG: glycosyltransferase [Exilispira sp.]